MEINFQILILSPNLGKYKNILQVRLLSLFSDEKGLGMVLEFEYEVVCI